MFAMYVVFTCWVFNLCGYLISEIHDNVVVCLLSHLVHCSIGCQVFVWTLCSVIDSVCLKAVELA